MTSTPVTANGTLRYRDQRRFSRPDSQSFCGMRQSAMRSTAVANMRAGTAAGTPTVGKSRRQMK